MSTDFDIDLGGQRVRITNPEKLLWPEAGISKLDYIHYLVEMSPYLLPYIKDRLLTTIRFPDGIHGKSFYQKNIPEHAPEWVVSHSSNGVKYLLAGDLPTLVWLWNQACLELHVAFNLYQRPGFPTELVFDLDPSVPDPYSLVLETALAIKEVLDSLGLFSQPKTSGATGLQIYIPIIPKYTYSETRLLNEFIARYIAAKYPERVTLERLVKNRGTRLYFDYLQHWESKTLPAPYSPRARVHASVSAPVSWQEVHAGFSPEDFTILNIRERVQRIGDLFKPVTSADCAQSLDEILNFIRKQST